MQVINGFEHQTNLHILFFFLIIKIKNKGIGYAVVRHLALNYANSSPSQPLTILLTARNPTLGQSSTVKLREELKPNILVDDGGKVDLKFSRLDIADELSIKEAKEIIEK